MLIPVNNSLPTIYLALGQNASDTAVNLGCLFDSCTAVSSGYKLFHWYLVSKYPDIVHSYEECNSSSNPFQPIKLASAVKDTAASNGKDILGELSAVICYYMPYHSSDGQPCVISFALSDIVTVNTIIRWPTIATLGMNLLISEKVMTSIVANQNFPIVNQEPRLGLPQNVTFNPTDFQPPLLPTMKTVTTDNTQSLHQLAAYITPPAIASPMKPPAKHHINKSS